MVMEHLNRRCADHGVRLVFAAEKGSRCFGTQDPSSDHDLVAVVASPMSRYLSVDDVKESYGTEADGNVSSAFLDIRRAMRSSVMSRISFYSLGRSLDVAADPVGLGEDIRRLSALSLRPGSFVIQYLHHVEQALKVMAKGADAPKTWLHLLQPLMSLFHVAETGEGPPMDFRLLAEACRDRDLGAFAVEMAAVKLSGGLGAVGAPEREMVARHVERARVISREWAESNHARDPRHVEMANAVVLRVIAG